MRWRDDPAVPSEQIKVGQAGAEAAGAMQEQERRAVPTLPHIDVDAGQGYDAHVRFLPLSEG